MCRAPDFTTHQAKPTEAVAKAAPAPSTDDAASARKTVEALPPSHADAARRTTVWDSTMGLTATLILWPLILSVPLVLQHTYRDVFDEAWYDYSQGPKPLGLCLGLLASRLPTAKRPRAHMHTCTGTQIQLALRSIRFGQPNSARER